MVSECADVEPILPMGLLIEKLGCKIEWNSEGVCLRHPHRGISRSKSVVVALKC